MGGSGSRGSYPYESWNKIIHEAVLQFQIAKKQPDKDWNLYIGSITYHKWPSYPRRSIKAFHQSIPSGNLFIRNSECKAKRRRSKANECNPSRIIRICLRRQPTNRYLERPPYFLTGDIVTWQPAAGKRAGINEYMQGVPKEACSRGTPYSYPIFW